MGAVLPAAGTPSPYRRGVAGAARADAGAVHRSVPRPLTSFVGRLAELGRLRLCVSGSAPLPADLHHALADGGTSVLERYGLTETLMKADWKVIFPPRAPG